VVKREIDKIDFIETMGRIYSRGKMEMGFEEWQAEA